MLDRADLLVDLEGTISHLKTEQFEPRMEKLVTIEKDLRKLMENYINAEEAMEVGICWL